mmetsp:Transcript_12187/g.19700  ORF Transcript_12187/g.19700 Transcript_12187/m.19700 type:complete len:506 (+) Transcript_12187:217-1734(+)|eukprot:CAMPEP_0184643342 /NCGR_PEP_ID=MMETSP0308-20130426/168_1 /TAXON_ID=38269 /ORGANISM="Gloeochaete witrockiana, Strain SAG 46.84" /LENGTH=505 /DNA_ID=CAMNT_0027071213 /DNA_START=176 /DNA_END=1693 /DNA_ORIENTATION=-
MGLINWIKRKWLSLEEAVTVEEIKREPCSEPPAKRPRLLPQRIHNVSERAKPSAALCVYFYREHRHNLYVPAYDRSLIPLPLPHSNPTHTTVPFDTLPFDLIVRILSLLSLRDRAAASRVSKRFRGCAHDPTLWREVDLTYLGARVTDDVLALVCHRALQLQSLHIRSPLISSKQLGMLTECASTLTSLNLSGCDMLTSGCFYALGKLTNLRRLDMSYWRDMRNVKVPYVFLWEIGYLKQLESLNLSGLKITHDEDCADIISTRFPRLRQICISPSTDDSAEWLATMLEKLTTLESLTLDNVFGQTTALSGSFQSWHKLNSLKALHLSGVNFLGGGDLSFVRSLPALTDLNLTFESLSDSDLGFLSSLSRLSRLTLREITPPEDDIPVTLPPTLIALETFILRGVGARRVVLPHLPLLTHLELRPIASVELLERGITKLGALENLLLTLTDGEEQAQVIDALRFLDSSDFPLLRKVEITMRNNQNLRDAVLCILDRVEVVIKEKQ